jgi:hypothetical protein
VLVLVALPGVDAQAGPSSSSARLLLIAGVRVLPRELATRRHSSHRSCRRAAFGAPDPPAGRHLRAAGQRRRPTAAWIVRLPRSAERGRHEPAAMLNPVPQGVVAGPTP